MANQYLDTDYVDAHLGSNVRSALFTPSGGSYSSTNFNTLAIAATSVIEAALYNSGYTPPTATVSDLSAVVEYVKLATYGVFRELASTRPEKSLALPEDWASNPAKQAFQNIVDGTAMLGMTVNTGSAIGGLTFSETSESVSSNDGSRTHIFSRKGMQEY